MQRKVASVRMHQQWKQNRIGLYVNEIQTGFLGNIIKTAMDKDGLISRKKYLVNYRKTNFPPAYANDEHKLQIYVNKGLKK